MKRQHLMTITESQYGAERDLDGPLDPKFQAMQDKIFALHAARSVAAAMLETVLNGTPADLANYANSEACAQVRRDTVAGVYGKSLAFMAKNILEVTA